MPARVTLERIDELISDASLEAILRTLVDEPSPTGEEGRLAREIVTMLNGFGITAQEQAIDATQANAVGSLGNPSGEERLLLYAPIDTVTSNNEEEDLPWAGPALRPDMVARSYLSDGHIFGLGAHNPKGHAATILEAGRVLAQLDISLPGELQLGFGAGGMPTHARPGMRADSGHGVGCRSMLQRIRRPGAAVIAKSGWSVAWEEVGFLWLEVCVQGIHTYVGSRHLLTYRNAIEAASRLVVALERWFEERAERSATPLIKPQAVVSHIEAGWRRMPAFTPAVCRLLVDFRFGPDSDAETAESQFVVQLCNLSNELGLATTHRVIQSIPATRTPPDTPIVRTCIRAWEQVAGRAHAPIPHTSGATDANILRANGIPTARVGLPKAQRPDMDFQLGMNCVALHDLRQLTRLLVVTALNYFGVETGV